MRDLAEDVKGNLKGAPFEFAIKLFGSDLEKDGITRNQSVRDFKQENQTVAEILTALVRKANPITTVKDPSEADQKLIWVIGPDPENAGKAGYSDYYARPRPRRRSIRCRPCCALKK